VAIQEKIVSRLFFNWGKVMVSELCLTQCG